MYVTAEEAVVISVGVDVFTVVTSVVVGSGEVVSTRVVVATVDVTAITIVKLTRF